MSEMLSVEMVFVCPGATESGALMAYLQTISGPGSLLLVENLDVNASLGAFKTEKVVSLVLVFSGNIAMGVVGNAVYDALKAAPNAQCVVSGEPLDKATAADKAKLDEKVRASAQLRKGGLAGH